jgi:RNA polymerase sigma-70 factor (ECF subfamily)
MARCNQARRLLVDPVRAMKRRASGEERRPSPPVDAEALLLSGYRYALSLAHEPSAAEDLLQDACLAILAARGSWERPYLFATIRNRFIDRCRRDQKLRFLSLERGGDDPPEEPAGDWEAPDVLRNGRLERALGALRCEEREALFLAVVEGYTAEEIGELTSRPRGTVLSLLHRTKAKLRKLLEQETEVLG